MGICFNDERKIQNININNLTIKNDDSLIKNSNNKNTIINSGCCCPSCGEPAGKKFKGSGDDKEYFDCLKCGQNQFSKTYFKCKTCNSIFCSICPYKNDGLRCNCPACGEKAGNSFQGSGNDKEYFDCLKCGQNQFSKTYFKCKKCKGIFCYKCPQNSNSKNNNKKRGDKFGIDIETFDNMFIGES